MKDTLHTYLLMMDSARHYATTEHPSMESPDKVAAFMRPLCQTEAQETFWVLVLNTRNALIEVLPICKGLVDRTQVHAREVFRQAIVLNASKIIICHNHPSGDPTPSSQDIECTRAMVSAGKVLGIECIDHVIIGTRTPVRYKDYLSMRENNLL